MSFLIVIPARYSSQRFPGKPLAALRGASGVEKSLIRRSWEAAKAVAGSPRVVIATDDDRICRAAEEFGAEVVMTPETCANGTERCASAAESLGGDFEVIVNLQGDAPLTPAWFVEDLVDAMRKDRTADIATPVLQCDGAVLNTFLEDRRAGRVGGTTAVFARDSSALYFSKEVIPFTSTPYPAEAPTPVFHHVGVYAYTPDSLKAYASWPIGPLERLEGLEQLRFLEQGRRVLCVEVQGRGRAFWEVNNPEDIPRVEGMLARMRVD